MCACSLRPQAGFGSPRPNAGEGLGVRGIPIEWTSTRNPALDEGSGALQDQSAVRAPPHPMKASQAFILFPRWGEGNRSRLSFSIEFLERQSVSSPYSAILNNYYYFNSLIPVGVSRRISWVSTARASHTRQDQRGNTTLRLSAIRQSDDCVCSSTCCRQSSRFGQDLCCQPTYLNTETQRHGEVTGYQIVQSEPRISPALGSPMDSLRLCVSVVSFFLFSAGLRSLATNSVQPHTAQREPRAPRTPGKRAAPSRPVKWSGISTRLDGHLLPSLLCVLGVLGGCVCITNLTEL